MIQIGFTIYADKNCTLRRISNGEWVGPTYSPGYVYYVNGERLPEPILETVEDFKELTESEVKDILNYGSFVDQRIREKYTVSDELAIQRQRDTKPEAFEEYFKYCEECKKKAVEDCGLNNIVFAD